jgi:hypothetical protein
VRAAACALAALSIAGCGAESKSAQPANAPTVSLWISATAKDYRQVAAGAKLALAQRGGRAGVFRINYAGKQVSDDAARATVDALNNARTAVQDTQASAVITDVARAQAEPAITLLNEAGIPTVALGDAVRKPVACSARSDIYPNGHATAITIPEMTALPLSFRADFLARLGFPPTEAAWGAYQGARAVLAALATADVATDESPPRLDRDALAAELVRSHGGCA